VFIREPVSNIAPFRRLRLLSLRNYIIHAAGLLPLSRSEHLRQPSSYTETFGPASIKRRIPSPMPGKPWCRASKAVQVLFTRSLKEAEWELGAGTLLEPAEAHGLRPEFGCRSCTCGTCRVCVIAGKAAYEAQTSTECGDTEALICCAVLAASESGEAGPLHLRISRQAETRSANFHLVDSRSCYHGMRATPVRRAD
jgi:ferredoxin